MSSQLTLTKLENALADAQQRLNLAEETIIAIESSIGLVPPASLPVIDVGDGKGALHLLRLGTSLLDQASVLIPVTQLASSVAPSGINPIPVRDSRFRYTAKSGAIIVSDSDDDSLSSIPQRDEESDEGSDDGEDVASEAPTVDIIRDDPAHQPLYLSDSDDERRDPDFPLRSNSNKWFAVIRGRWIGVTNSRDALTDAIYGVSEKAFLSFDTEERAVLAYNSLDALNLTHRL
ncbi:hypothetical protein BDN72DRAFT_901367 [Pluteus cervinus]|uniref:Uncharacterized protein n=1 Tax=Pluteus cervinus TaxID=181527 RepID=A0ACD3AGB6_9AGAR|nr:hypothetical protein BDN72DRAFT_901367 [Pluteus cervinus]